MDEERKEYEVGYGRPPKENQFPKGTSGNPNGRPKGSRSLSSIWKDIMARPVSLTEGSQHRTVSYTEAVLTQVANGAARGDRHSRRDYLQLTRLVESEEENEGRSRKLHERDKALMEGIKKRLLQVDPESFEALSDAEGEK